MARFVFVALAICISLALADDTKYSTENDNFDLEGVIAKPEEFKKFTGCFLDRNPCDAVASDFKNDFPEVFKEACAKCTDAQKHLMNRYLAVVKEQYPQDFEEIKKKYDPESKYLAALLKAVANA
uniref:Chemosensory protein n=1 Tax=Glyphodes pyloalis TaxID=1242752 RepID=A0A6M3GU70_GLYPY|nr:chemosensory protein [Glyphodes pyloalis]